MIVIPKLMGIAVYSPQLDYLGNSVRGIELCKRLVQMFNFHASDSLTDAIRGNHQDVIKILQEHNAIQ